MQQWLAGLVLAVGLLGGVQARAGTDRELSGREDPAISAAAQQLIEHAGQHRLIVLGEPHGTREIPALVARLVAHYSQQQPVTLALEMWHTEQAALDAYLASAGSKADWQALASTPFWQVSNDQHDGRRSVQMRQLVEALRVLRDNGGDVRVLAYDVSREQADTHDHHWRDRQMATNLRTAWVQQRERRMLVLTGNVHAMRVRPSWAPAELQAAPMTSQLLELSPYVVNLTGASGHYWACLAPRRCQALESRSWRGGADVEVHTDDGRAYDLWLRLPRLSVADLLESGR